MLNLFSNSSKKKRYSKLNFENRIKDEEIIKIYNSFNEKELNYKIVWGLLMATGARISEICCLKLQDFDKDYVTVRHKVLKKKNLEYNTKFLPSQLAELIKYYIKLNYPIILRYEGYLFATNNPKSKKHFLQSKTVRWMLWKKRNELGLNDYIQGHQKWYRINLHSCRHWVVTKLIKKQGVEFARQFIKHSKVDTTMQYCDSLVNNKAKKEVVDKLFSEFFDNKPLITKNQQRLTMFL